MTNRKRKAKEEVAVKEATTTTTLSPKKKKTKEDDDHNAVIASSIIDRLRGPHPLEALKLFASSLENDYDLVAEFVSLGGRSEDLLRILEEKNDDEKDEKVKAPEVSVVFNAVETLFLYVAQQQEEQLKCRSLTTDVVRKILKDHKSNIMRLLSPTNTAYQARSTLRMLTAMVTCGDHQFSRDILLAIDFEDKNFEGLLRRRSRDSAVDVRTSLVHFLVSFLIHGNTLVVKEFLEKRTKFTQIFPGLLQDSATTVEFVMMALTEKVSENAGVSKTSKMKLFSVYNLRPLLSLLSQWKGSRRMDDDEEGDEEEQFKEEKERVVAATKKFFTKIMTSTKLGIIFHDPTCGHSGQNQNHLLLSLLQAIPEPWDDENKSRLVTSALSICPDQVRPYLVSLEKFWTPRSTEQWLNLADLVCNIFKSLKLDEIVTTLDNVGQPKFVVSVLSNLCFPEKMMREMVLPALESEEEEGHSSVRRKGISLLRVLLENAAKGFIKARDQQVKKNASSRILERLPGPELLLQFWNHEVKEIDAPSSIAILHFVEVLECLMRHYPNKYSSHFDVAKILQQLHGMSSLHKSTTDLSRARLILMKLLHRSSESVTTVFNEEHLLLLVTSFVHSTDEESKTLALDLLNDMLSAGIVENESHHRHDLRVWLHFIRPEECDTLAEIVVRCLVTKTAAGRSPEKTIKKGSRRSQVLAEEENFKSLFSPLTISLLEDSRIRKNVEYLERTIAALIFVQENVDQFCTYLETLRLNLKKVDKIIRGVKKGEIGSFSTGDDGADFFSVFLKIMQCLTKCSKMKSEVSPLTEIGDMLSTMDDQQMKKRLTNQVLQSLVVMELFQPFASDCRDASRFVCDQLLCTRKPEENDYFKIQFLTQCKNHLDEKVCDDLDDGTQDVILKSFQQFSYTSEELNNLALLIFNRKSSTTSAIFLLTCVLEIAVERKMFLSQDAEQAFKSRIVKLLDHKKSVNNRLYETVAKYLLCNCDDAKMMTEIFPTDVMERYWKNIHETKELVLALVTMDAEQARTFVKFLSDNMTNWYSKNALLILGNILQAKHALTEDELSSLRSGLKTQLKNFLDKGECLEDGEDDICLVVELLCNHYDCNLAGIKPDFELRSIQQLRGRLAVAQVKGAKFASLVLLRGMQFVVENMKKLVVTSSQSSLEVATELFVLLGKCLDISTIETDVLFESDQDVWTHFVKIVLKYGLKNRGENNDAKLNEICLKTLRRLLPIVYKSSSSRLEEVKLIYSMVFGHSSFMQVMLDSSSFHQHSSTKAELSLLLLTLMRLNPSICESANIPIFLGAYQGTLSRSDQAVLKLLREYEINKVSGLGQYFPIIFGQSAVSHYSVRKENDGIGGGAAALWKRPKASEILALIEPERMTRSAVNFPLEMKLVPSEEEEEVFTDESTYDPRFFLSLAAQVCSPGSFVDRHLKLVESGLLSLVFASLSSHDPSMRASGYVVLSRVSHQLETAKLTAEKRIWLHLIDLVRNGVRTAKGDHRLRIPPVVAVFLIRVSAILHSPLHPMYKAISSFVLAKPTLELFNVPEFLRLFHSKEGNNNSEERNWILEVLRDGMRDELDYQIVQKDFVFKLVMSFHGSALATDDEASTTRGLIRQILLKAVRLVQPAFDLVRHHGLNLWIVAELSASSSSVLTNDRESMMQDMLEIVTTALGTIVRSLAEGALLPGTIFHDFRMVLDSFEESKRGMKCWKEAQKMLLESRPVSFGYDN